MSNSPEVIQAAREARARGEFDREVVNRVADDLQFDQLTLSCGHTIQHLAGLSIGKVDCRRCIEQWMQDQEQQ